MTHARACVRRWRRFCDSLDAGRRHVPASERATFGIYPPKVFACGLRVSRRSRRDARIAPFWRHALRPPGQTGTLPRGYISLRRHTPLRDVAICDSRFLIAVSRRRAPRRAGSDASTASPQTPRFDSSSACAQACTGCAGVAASTVAAQTPRTDTSMRPNRILHPAAQVRKLRRFPRGRRVLMRRSSQAEPRMPPTKRDANNPFSARFHIGSESDT